MVPNPEDLMKVTGFTGDSSDDELSRVNLVKVVDGLTEAPGRRALRRNVSEMTGSTDISSIKSQSDQLSTISEDQGPYASINDPIRVGDRVCVKNKYVGTCKFVGPISEKRKSDENFIGVQLDDKITSFGGVFGTKEYFECPFGHGIMVTFKNVKKVKSFVQKPEKVKNQNNKILNLKNQQFSAEVQEAADFHLQVQQHQLAFPFHQNFCFERMSKDGVYLLDMNS